MTSNAGPFKDRSSKSIVSWSFHGSILVRLPSGKAEWWDKASGELSVESANSTWSHGLSPRLAVKSCLTVGPLSINSLKNCPTADETAPYFDRTKYNSAISRICFLALDGETNLNTRNTSAGSRTSLFK